MRSFSLGCRIYYRPLKVREAEQKIAELERRMRVNDMIIRYITVRVDEDRKKADKMKEKREKRAATRAKFRQTEETAPEAAV